MISAGLAALSALRYASYNASMFDLGHMAQAVWSSTRGRPLEFSYHGASLSRLALHAELVYFLLTPLYALFPSPITLLIVQALLYGAGSLPLYRLARRRTGEVNAARLIVLIYLLYPMAHTAVLYDFHGDTLAMSFLLFALDALDREVWRGYAVWLTLTLASKVYVAAPVCLLGTFLWFKGQRRVGGLTVLMGALWGIVVYFGVRPLFTTAHAGAGQLSAMGYAQFYFGQRFDALTTSWPLRLATAFAVFAPVMPIALYAPDWTALAMMVALPVLLSSGPGPSYLHGGHHYAVVVPFLAMAAVWGTVRLQQRARTFERSGQRGARPVTWPIAVGAALVMTILANLGLVNTPLSPRHRSLAPEAGALGWAYSRSSRDALKDRWLDQHVPDEVPVLASMMLATHLTDRQELHIAIPLDDTPPPPLDDLLDIAEYVVLDGLLDYIEPGGRGSMVGEVGYDWPVLAAALTHPAFGLTSAQDGLLLLRRRDAAMTDYEWEQLTVEQSVSVEYRDETPPVVASFGDAIGLIEASATSVPGGRYRLRFVWLALGDLRDADPWFAVTELDGVDDARMLHVPTITLYPTTEWRAGDVIAEEFEADVPDDVAPGVYALRVGWYDSGHAHAYATDERSRIGAAVEVGALRVSD